MVTELIPVAGLTVDEVHTVLRLATSAPSLHNSQPWRFRCTPSAIELYGDPSRAVPVADPDRRELHLACGAALLNLRLGIRSLGRDTDVRLCPLPDRPKLLAVVRPGAAVPLTPEEKRLVDAIPRRRTNRRPFTPEPISDAVRHELRRAAEIEHCALAELTPTQRAVLRDLARRAHQIQRSNPAFVAEWRYWNGRDDDAVDGVPVRCAGPLPEPHDEWVLRDFSAGKGRARVSGKDFEHNPMLAVVCSYSDLPFARLQAGQALQRVLLTATANGASASFLSQVIEVPDTRAELGDLLDGGSYPQAVLRIGYGYPVPPTPRRAVADVLGEASARDHAR